MTDTQTEVGSSSSYRVIVKNTESGNKFPTFATSSPARLTVNLAPASPSVIPTIIGLVDQSIPINSGVTFSIIASSSTGTLSYQ